MRSLLLCLAFITACDVHAQSISSVNFNYLYNLQGEASIQFYPVKQRDSIIVYYTLRTNNPAVTSYMVQWEKRDSYNQRQGAIFMPNDTVRLTGGIAAGIFRFSTPAKPWLLTAKVTNKISGKAWYFFKQIEEHYPVNGFLEKNGEIQGRTFIAASGRYRVHGSGSGRSIHFSFYKDDFPTPSPPFADKELKIDRFLFPDSTFTVSSGQEIGPFGREGLYLGQEDTLSAEGFSFLVKKEPYPKYNTLRDLKGPLLFVTTREENDLIGAAGEDKAKFDKVILDITNDKERAKNFMRSYFKRVEYANFVFTSFKEGWKTDRGMIIIVFGAPDEVMMNGQQEIWGYKATRQQFFFNKAGSVYYPDHYVLIRDPKFTENWYMTIDLWRKSRF